jgi:hypothetical protein
MTGSDTFYRAAERRIELVTLGLGAAASLAGGIRWGWRAAAGVALGAALAWVNYRWLKQGVAALAHLFAAQAGAAEVRIPKGVYVKFLGRFALLIVVVYVILSRSWVPTVAVLVGLFSLAAAVLIEMIFQLVRGGPQPDAS